MRSPSPTIKRKKSSGYQKLICKICGDSELVIVFTGKIRDGLPGKLTPSNHKVFQCSKCRVRFLEKFCPQELNESEAYKKNSRALVNWTIFAMLTMNYGMIKYNVLEFIIV
jgi:hypothetical protein